MLTLNNISYFIGGRALYRNITLQIKPKDKIGLIGANGTGKSTLLKVITAELTPDEGNIQKSKDCTIGFLNQDLLSFQSEESILAVAMEAFEEATKIQILMDHVIHKMETDYNNTKEEEEDLTTVTSTKREVEVVKEGILAVKSTIITIPTDTAIVNEGETDCQQHAMDENMVAKVLEESKKVTKMKMETNKNTEEEDLTTTTLTATVSTKGGVEVLEEGVLAVKPTVITIPTHIATVNEGDTDCQQQVTP